MCCILISQKYWVFNILRKNLFNNYTDTVLVNEQLTVFNFFDSICDIFFSSSNLELNFILNRLPLNSDFLYSNTFSKYGLHNTDNDIIFNSVYADCFYFLNNFFSQQFGLNVDYNLDFVFNFYYLSSFVENNYFYKLLPGFIFNNQLISHSTWVLVLFTFILFYCVLVWFYLFFGENFNKNFINEKSYDEYNNTINYVIESEKELGSIDDMFVGVSILICVYGWFFFGTVFLNFFSGVSLQHLYVGFPLFILGVLGMPSNMIWNYGILFPVFLRGSSNTTILILEFMYDVLATMIMFIRLVVQNVRFLLMFFAFFECYEFFYNFIFIIKNNYFFDYNNTTQSSYCVFVLSTLNFIIFYTYNIFHLMYTIVSHFFAYIVLVFWFFSFLYTTFLSEKLETYFKAKNSKTNIKNN